MGTGLKRIFRIFRRIYLKLLLGTREVVLNTLGPLPMSNLMQLNSIFKTLGNEIIEPSSPLLHILRIIL